MTYREPIFVVIGGLGTNIRYMQPFIDEIHKELKNIPINDLNEVLNESKRTTNHNFNIINHPLMYSLPEEINLLVDVLPKDKEYILIGYSAGCSLALELTHHIKALKVFLCNPINIEKRFSTEFIEALSSFFKEEESEKELEKELEEESEKKESDVEEEYLDEFSFLIHDLHNFIHSYNGVSKKPNIEDNVLDIIGNDFFRMYVAIVTYNYWIPILWTISFIWNLLYITDQTWIMSRFYYELYGRHTGEIDYKNFIENTSTFSNTFEDIVLLIRDYVVKPNLYDLVEHCSCPIDIILGETDLYRTFTEDLHKKGGKKTNLYYMKGDHHILYRSPRESAEFITELF
jgi:pimeloyl-ACP methyl ester carboxylesterase